MASGFRHPNRTQSGREVKLTTKARKIMADSVWNELTELLVVIRHSEDVLVEAIRARKSKRLATALYSAWAKNRTELEEMMREYWSLATDEEQEAREKDFQKWDEQLDEVAAITERYLCEDEPSRKVKIEKNAALAVEGNRLAAEIKRVEQQISNLSVKTPPATGTDATPAWVTVSRCDGDATRPSTVPNDRSTRPSFQPNAASSPRRVDSATEGSSDKLLTTIASALSSRREMLPRLEPETFSGEMMKFPMWLNSFEALIEKHTASMQERLFFLGKYTSGEAHEAISGYLTLFAEDAYPRAKKLLTSRYGDRLKVAQAYRNKLFSWATVKKNDGTALQQYADFLWQCNAAMQSVGHLESLNSAEENARMVRVLPQYVIDKWFRTIDRWCHQESSVYSTDGDVNDTSSFPPFEEFCRLVSTEARIVTGPAFKLFNQTPVEKTKVEPAKPSPAKSSRRAQSFASSASQGSETSTAKPKTEKKQVTPSCFYCKDTHFLSQCDKFLKMPAAMKKDFAAENHLCFGCLGRGHGFRVCRWKNPDLLKEPEPIVKSTTMNTRAETKLLSSRGSFFSMVVPVRVRAPEPDGRSAIIYALLDTQSDTTFVSEELVETLGLKTDQVQLHLVTMGGAQNVPSERVTGLRVEDVFSGSSLVIEECFTRVVIPASRSQLPDPRVAERFEHLRPMLNQMVPLDESIPVAMLIGNDQPAAFVHHTTLHLNDSTPFGVRTKLGWRLMGKRDDSRDDEGRCFSTSARIVNVNEIAKVFDLDFNDIKPSEEKMSYDDQLFLQKARETIVRKPDGRYEMELPFKQEPVMMPNNRDVAYKRLMSIRRKIRADPEYKKMYCKFMNDLLENDYAEPAPAEHVEGGVQFLPHHAVAHPRKPGELRGVFDAAAEKSGVSLNKMLLPGPDMTNNLLGVLCNFRRERVAFMCDIKKMFMQVGVAEKHRDFLRYLWFENGDPDGDVIEYRMKVLSFGATSSPACASYVLKELAEAHREDYSQDVIDFVKRQFYVDDGLAAKETARMTAKMFMDSHDLCSRGGFWLHKFTSNSPEALAAVPEKLLSTSVQEWMMNPDQDGVEASLGLTWDRLRDVFVFIIKSFNKQLTRRGLLSSLSGIYDPIGFLSPVILVGRLLLQELCGQALPWDQPLDERYAERWLEWYGQLSHLADYSIPRCVRVQTEGRPVKTEMHHFCDASSVGYGACSYLRVEDEDGRVDVSLILAKARVGPKRPVTIPRMELQSAVLASKLAVFLDREMAYDDVEHWFWTDSMVVLGYISNPAKRFHLYVANRVQRIHDSSDPSHWHHVAGEENPADAASRGITASELTTSPIWLHGPGFIRRVTTPAEPTEISQDDPEIKRTSVVCATKTEASWIQKLAGAVSSWTRLIRTVAVMMKYVKYLGGERKQAKVGAYDLQIAGEKVLSLAQQQEFAEELEILTRLKQYPRDRGDVRARNEELRVKSRLKQLDVFLDDDSVIRVGGRLRRAYMPVKIKHPVVVPRRGRVTWLLILQAHLRARHAGRQQTLSELRMSGVWVIHARSAVDEVLRSCITCKKIKATPMIQKMSDLPTSRVEESPPFSYCGVDLFGPVQVKEGRSLKKRWVCLITCMASRAVQLEPVYSLTTDSFLNALRRLIARRGPVKQIYCDQGTNFVGASREMKSCLAEMDEDALRRELLKESCDWSEFKFNPPTASHMGGVWERMVKSAKSVLLHMLSQLGEWVGDEMLWTLLAEVESTLNNRPITCVDVQDPWGEPPLTPARLLTQKYRGASSPPGKFDDVEVYGRKSWRRVQAMADRFWRQWRVEFLPDLQLRKKWANRQFNLKVGDVVLMVDKELKRNQWPMARVVETLPSDDGLVRSVRLRVGHTFFERPIAKLIFLCATEE